MTYYERHKEKALEYQQLYNMIHAERIKKYQEEYFKKHKANLNKKQRDTYKEKKPKERKPLPPYKLENLERMLRKKLKHINNIILSENPSKLLTQIEERCITPLLNHPNKYQAKKLLKKYQYSLEQVQPFSEFVITPEGFSLSFD